MTFLSNSITKKSKLPYPSRKELPRIAADLYDRLFPNTVEGQGNHESSEESDFELDDVEDEPIAKKSRQEEVKEALAKAC